MRTPLPGRFFYEVPEHQPLLKKWMTGLGDEDTFVLLLKKYHQHREAHRPDTVWMALRYAWRPQERNPWQYGAELLEWGMHQPWASSIDIRAVVNAFTARYTHDERPKAWRTLPTRIPKLFQQAVARAVAENIQNPASWLLSDGSKLESLQEWACNGAPCACKPCNVIRMTSPTQPLKKSRLFDSRANGFAINWQPKC